MSLVFDRVPLVYSRAAANLTWEDIGSDKFTQLKEHPLKPVKARDTDMPLHLPNNEMPSVITTLCHDSSMLLPSKGTISEVLNPGLFFASSQRISFTKYSFKFRLTCEMVLDFQN
jgi:hypothetical protein